MGFPEASPKHIRWSALPLKQKSKTADGQESNTFLRVSNDKLRIPEGLQIFVDFLTHDECIDLLAENDRGSPEWEGFEQRRKVQRWDRKDPKLPDILQTVANRFESTTGRRPLKVTLEEYPASQLQKYFNDLQALVTTFESVERGSPEDEQECFSCVIPIASSVAEFINRPKERKTDCWNFLSDAHHSSGLILDRRSLYLKTHECFWEWRSRINSAIDAEMERGELDDSFRGRFVLVKFTRLPPTGVNLESSEQTKQSSYFGYLADPEDVPRSIENMPPMKELLTVVVTTSPIQSNPSTELFERVFHTFFQGGEEFALRCRKIIVCDGCRGGDGSEKVSKRHSTVKQSMRNGIVNTEQLENYKGFKVALRTLCNDAPPSSPFHTAEVEELDQRHGYGYALRHALRHCVQTPYMIVIQHDRTFMRTCPILESLKAMWCHRNIKYVGMSMRSNLFYRDIFLAKYGRRFCDEMAACTLRPPELALDASKYGPDSESTRSIDHGWSVKLQENIATLAESYKNTMQNQEYLEWKRNHPLPDGKWQLSLTPTFFWYDNTHICETEHYRDFVFNPQYKMVVRGGFVEDRLSPVIKKTVERLGLSEGHKRFGCYLLDDHSGLFFTGHLDGGAYLTKVQKDAIALTRKSTHHVK